MAASIYPTAPAQGVTLRFLGKLLLIGDRAKFGEFSQFTSTNYCPLVKDGVSSTRRLLEQYLTDPANRSELKRFWIANKGFIASLRIPDIVNEITSYTGRYFIVEMPDDRNLPAAYVPPEPASIVNQDVRNIPGMTTGEKFALALKRTPDHLGQALKNEFASILTPAAIATTVSVIAILVAGGPITATIIMTVGFVLAGWQIFKAAGNIIDFITLTKNAKTEAEINEAARLLARAAAQLGIGVLISLLTRGAGRAASTMKRTANKADELPALQPKTQTSVPKTPKLGTLSNKEAREWYLAQEKLIPKKLDPLPPLEDQAKHAHRLRNEARTTARDLMADRELAAKITRENPNLTWEQLVEKTRKKGYSGDDIYRQIIDSSQRSRTSVNKKLGLD